MSRIEFSKAQLNGPKNVLGYPETPYKSSHVETTKQPQVVFEAASSRSSLVTKKSK